MVNKVLDGILGLCIGDACGVPLEYSLRSVLKEKPVTDMKGYGTYYQPPGTWSDDSAMTLATVHSLCEGLDYDRIMKRFIAWYREGEYTANDEVFDIGNITRKALNAYDGTKPSYECGLGRERDNGNGSLMRILPFAFYCKSLLMDGIYLTDQGFSVIHKASCLTHAHPISQIACGIYVSIAILLCDVVNLVDLQEAVRYSFRYYRKNKAYAGWIERFNRIEDLEEFRYLPEEEIRSSSYVVDTLEAALWCLLNTESYEECILKAINLGDDTDTVAAVAGGLAGLKYGASAIPKHWLEQLAKKDEIIDLCEAYYSKCLRRDAQRFIPFLLYFEERKGRNICEWKGTEMVSSNVYRFSYPVYESQVYDLMENVIPHSMFVEPEYQRILEKKGYKDIEDAMTHVEEMDLPLLSALLTAVSRKEKLEDGFWNSVSRNGGIYLLLKRIIFLTSPNGLIRTKRERHGKENG